MFKLVALLFLAAVVVAKPGAIYSSVLTDEKVIESHGNSVVHASAPVLQYPTVYSAPSIVHGLHAYNAAPLIPQYHPIAAYYK